jgi:hypothetical protein
VAREPSETPPAYLGPGTTNMIRIVRLDGTGNRVAEGD